jgi:hypothetical protein
VATNAEIRAEYMALMGAELGELHYLLWGELSWLHTKWAEFRELFATKPSRVDLMNHTAPVFFVHLHDVLWDDAIMHLARLTDPPIVSGRENLSFNRLPDAVAHLPVRDDVKQGLSRLRTATRFVRNWRNRRLAHRDLAHARNPRAYPLAQASRVKMEKALAAARDLMAITEEHFTKNDVQYDHVIRAHGGAEEMLFYLDSGLDAAEARKAARSHIRWEPKLL